MPRWRCSAFGSECGGPFNSSSSSRKIGQLQQLGNIPYAANGLGSVNALRPQAAALPHFVMLQEIPIRRHTQTRPGGHRHGPISRSHLCLNVQRLGQKIIAEPVFCGVKLKHRLPRVQSARQRRHSRQQVQVGGHGDGGAPDVVDNRREMRVT